MLYYFFKKDLIFINRKKNIKFYKKILEKLNKNYIYYDYFVIVD